MVGLAFIIFGRKIRDKDYGPAYPGYCQHCQNETWLHAYKYRSWGHIFWIPLLPWRRRRKLVCPICGMLHDLEKKSMKRAKELAKVMEYIDNGEDREDEFWALVEDFEEVAGLEEPEELEEAETEELEELEDQEDPTYFR